MKKAIMIFVTILFVAIAYNGYAHHRHQKHHQDEQKCMCDKQHQNGQNRPNNDGKFEHRGKGHPNSKKESTVIKDTINGKTAMVVVGSPLTPYETEFLMGE
jgi:hypothetical protein